jgi:error-prone DNA polymerase
MDQVETNQADLWATGLSPDSYPTEFVRADLDAAGVVTAAGLRDVPAGKRVTIAGLVTHRQRPATAQGVTFMNLEDETGLINVVCSAGAWKRYRRVARSSPALIIDGRVERVETVINVVAERISPLLLRRGGTGAGTGAGPGATLRSRDFR